MQLCLYKHISKSTIIRVCVGRCRCVCLCARLCVRVCVSLIKDEKINMHSFVNMNEKNNY